MLIFGVWIHGPQNLHATGKAPSSLVFEHIQGAWLISPLSNILYGWSGRKAEGPSSTTGPKRVNGTIEFSCVSSGIFSINEWAEMLFKQSIVSDDDAVLQFKSFASFRVLSQGFLLRTQGNNAVPLCEKPLWKRPESYKFCKIIHLVLRPRL